MPPPFGQVKIVVSRPIPDAFDLKQARIVRRASGYYVMLSLQCDVQVPSVMPHGEPLGMDVGLNSFVAVDGLTGAEMPSQESIKQKLRRGDSMESPL